MKTHYLKIKTEYYNAVANGTKTFEVRKNDRDFKVGDTLFLREIDINNNETYNSLIVKITYILENNEYLKDGYCVLGIEKIGNEWIQPFPKIENNLSIKIIPFEVNGNELEIDTTEDVIKFLNSKED